MPDFLMLDLKLRFYTKQSALEPDSRVWNRMSSLKNLQVIFKIQGSNYRKFAREGFWWVWGIFGGYFWKSFPCKNPRKNQEKLKKNQEKPIKTIKNGVFLIFPKFSLFWALQKPDQKSRGDRLLTGCQGQRHKIGLIRYKGLKGSEKAKENLRKHKLT